MWRKQLVDNTRQLKLEACRARQRTRMEIIMLGGAEVVRAVDAPDAIPMAEVVVGAGSDAWARANAGGGLVANAAVAYIGPS